MCEKTFRESIFVGRIPSKILRSSNAIACQKLFWTINVSWELRRCIFQPTCENCDQLDQSKIKSQVRIFVTYTCTGTNVVSSESRFEFTPSARSLPMLACDQWWWWMTNLRVPRLSWRVRPWNQGQPQRFALMSMKLTRNLTRDWYVTPVALSYYHSIKVTRSSLTPS